MKIKKEEITWQDLYKELDILYGKLYIKMPLKYREKIKIFIKEIENVITQAEKEEEKAKYYGVKEIWDKNKKAEAS